MTQEKEQIQEIGDLATERELKIIDSYRWFMNRISPFAVEIHIMQKDLVIKKEGIKIFNPDTKCWEDWKGV